VVPTAGLDAVEKTKLFLLPGIEPWPPKGSLYRLGYPGSRFNFSIVVTLFARSEAAIEGSNPTQGMDV
jgi:hypothetical protein